MINRAEREWAIEFLSDRENSIQSLLSYRAGDWADKALEEIRALKIAIKVLQQPPADQVIGTFGHAIEALKKGHRVTRHGWNGKGMFIYLTPGSTIPKHHLRPETADALSVTMGPTATFNSHIDMKTADGTIAIGWLASQMDMLAEDWMIVE